jgi:WD40 repeat protein
MAKIGAWMNDDHSTRVLSANTYELETVVPGEGTFIFYLCFNSNCTRLAATPSIEQIVNIYDATGVAKTRLCRLTHDLPLVSVAFHGTDPDVLVTMDMGCDVYKWNVATSNPVILFKLYTSLRMDHPAIFFNHDSSQLFTFGGHPGSKGERYMRLDAMMWMNNQNKIILGDLEFKEALRLANSRHQMNADEDQENEDDGENGEDEREDSADDDEEDENQWEDIDDNDADDNEEEELFDDQGADPEEVRGANSEPGASEGSDEDMEEVAWRAVTATDAADEGLVDYMIKMYDIDTGCLSGSFELLDQEQIRSFGSSPANNAVAIGCAKGHLYVWNPEASVSATRPLVGHSGAVCCSHYSADGFRLLTGSVDKTWKIWDVSNLAILISGSCSHPVESVWFNPVRAGEVLVCAGDELIVANSKSGEQLKHISEIGLCCISPPGVILL